jgi:hypothetical protein
MTTQMLGLLPESLLHTTWFAVLSTVVALNTLAYVALAAAKLLPAVRVGGKRGRERRSEDRSIRPSAGVEPSR